MNQNTQIACVKQVTSKKAHTRMITYSTHCPEVETCNEFNERLCQQNVDNSYWSTKKGTFFTSGLVAASPDTAD